MAIKRTRCDTRLWWINGKNHSYPLDNFMLILSKNLSNKAIFDKEIPFYNEKGLKTDIYHIQLYFSRYNAPIQQLKTLYYDSTKYEKSTITVTLQNDTPQNLLIIFQNSNFERLLNIDCSIIEEETGSFFKFYQ